MTGSVTELGPPPPFGASSFSSISVSASTAVPVYSPRTVSKLLPMVSTVRSPLAGAVHLNQTDASPPRGLGSSPASSVACLVDWLSVPVAPEMTVALT